MNTQPKPTGEPYVGLGHDGTDLPMSDQPKLTGEQMAVAMTRVCLWRLREERRSVEDAHGKDAVPAYLNRCIDHLSIFEQSHEPTTTGEWTVESVQELLGFDSKLGSERIADAHNVALVAERLKSRDAGFMNAANVKDRVIKQLRDQLDVQEAVIAKLDLVHRHALDAEREKVQTPKVKEGKEL